MRTLDLVKFSLLRLRWLCICAGVVGWSAVAVAQSPAPLALDDPQPSSVEVDPPAMYAGFIDFGDGPLAIPSHRSQSAASTQHPSVPARPTYAVLAAHLANWDADAEPDGWRCRVELRDRHDQAVRLDSASGVFELRLRVPRRDRSGYRDLGVDSIRWSQRLVFDRQGFAEVRLPLQSTLPAFYIDGSASSDRTRISRARFARHPQASGRFGEIWLAAGDRFVDDSPLSSSAFAAAQFGTMAVRVTVPSVGVLEAIDAVLADEPLLVDSNWPQR